MQQDKDKDTAAGASNNPKWWSNNHTSAWTRIKDALSRDWEQTKHDFSKKSGQELHQNVDDTVKQMAGKEPTNDFATHESEVRYGYGAGRQYAGTEFDKQEGTLQKEWDELKSGRMWADVRDHVKHGWDWSRRKD